MCTLFTILLENKNTTKKRKQKKKDVYDLWSSLDHIITFVFYILLLHTTIYARVVLSISMNLNRFWILTKFPRRRSGEKIRIKTINRSSIIFLWQRFCMFWKTKVWSDPLYKIRSRDDFVLHNIVAWIGPKKVICTPTQKKITRKKKYWRLYIIYI